LIIRPSGGEAADDKMSSVSRGRKKRLALGTPELTRLWGLSKDDLAVCRESKPPTVNSFFEEAIVQLDPAEAIEKEYW